MLKWLKRRMNKEPEPRLQAIGQKCVTDRIEELEHDLKKEQGRAKLLLDVAVMLERQRDEACAREERLWSDLNRLRLKIVEKSDIGCPLDASVIVTWVIGYIDGPDTNDTWGAHADDQRRRAEEAERERDEAHAEVERLREVWSRLAKEMEEIADQMFSDARENAKGCGRYSERGQESNLMEHRAAVWRAASIKTRKALNATAADTAVPRAGRDGDEQT